MRIVPALAAMIVGLFAIACSSNDDPLPPTVLLAVEAPLAERAQTVATEALQLRNITVELATAEIADIVITSQPEDDAERVTADFWVPVVQLPSRAVALTMDQLRGAVTGELDSWSNISGESTSIRVVVPV